MRLASQFANSKKKTIPLDFDFLLSSIFFPNLDLAIGAHDHPTLHELLHNSRVDQGLHFVVSLCGEQAVMRDQHLIQPIRFIVRRVLICIVLRLGGSSILRGPDHSRLCQLPIATEIPRVFFLRLLEERLIQIHNPVATANLFECLLGSWL